MGEILVGITSWTEKTLIESGRFYAANARTAEDRLRFYASQFPIVEVDSTYYAVPTGQTARVWVERTPGKFIFDIKAFRLLTLHPTTPQVLPPDIRKALPAAVRLKTSFSYGDLPDDLLGEVWRQFEDALLPLDSAGKLGVVLFQFPPWFFPGNGQREHILACKARLPQYHLAVEFRHQSWVSEKNIERTMRFLRDNDLAYVCVDEPQGFKSSVPPIAKATSGIGVVRFHGRNADAWETPTETAARRFNYLYSEEELREWVSRIKELAAKTRVLHVLFNNCYSDKAVVNARQIALMLD